MRLLHGLAIASAMLVALPTLSEPAEAGDRHHRHYSGGKQVFYDGPCRIERKWKGHGYKEKADCGYYAYGPAYYAYPAYPAYYYAPPPVVMVPRGPTISVTIPLD